MLDKTKVLQWNINGLRSRLPRIQHLVNEYQPKILALQEHKLNKINFNIFKGFKIYSFCRPVAGGGGVCIGVCNNIPSTQIPLQTNLEAVACKIFFKDFNLHVCNIYFNDDADINVNSLNNLFSSIPSPKLILGDFNAKHPNWGSPVSDPRGDIVLDFILNNNLYLLNDGSPTFYRASQDQYSHLDLTFCTNNISNKFSWETYHDRLSSDHFPIFITFKTNKLYATKSPRWKLTEANWSNYKNSISLPEHPIGINEYNFKIVSSINDSCKLAIPKTKSIISTKYSCFWWTPGCKLALSNAKRQLRTLQRFHSPANIVEYKRLDAIATRTLLEAKSVSWQKYLSTVNKDTKNKTLWKVINSLSGKNN